MGEALGTTLAVVSTADLCIKYGGILISKYRAYQNAETDIAELILRVEHHWFQTERQIILLRDCWGTLQTKYQDHMTMVLRRLETKLQEGAEILDRTIGKGHFQHQISLEDVKKKEGKVKKWKFALFVKDCLTKNLDDLEVWQKMFDPSWYLLIRISNESIDKALADNISTSGQISTMRNIRAELGARSRTHEANLSIFISGECFLKEVTSIPFSAVQVSKESKGGGDIIIDILPVLQSSNVTTTTKDVRNLARVLAKTDPLTFGLLSCRGVIKDLDPDGKVAQFRIIFSFPLGLIAPRSLRSLLLDKDQAYELGERVELANQLANSVLFVHTSKFVHKNIRPETVLIFGNKGSVLGTPFLVGFEMFRNVDGGTQKNGDSSWEKDLYRHPHRQGLRPEEEYIMQHDIYSLGVCLLEIGIWSSLVVWENAVSSLRSDIDIAGSHVAKDKLKQAFEKKRVLTQMAEKELPSRMGKKYTEIVVSCLTCLDSGSNAFGNKVDFLDEDGIDVGVRYIEKILRQIKEISV